jgi:hypothetical protein
LKFGVVAVKAEMLPVVERSMQVVVVVVLIQGL